MPMKQFNLLVDETNISRDNFEVESFPSDTLKYMKCRFDISGEGWDTDSKVAIFENKTSGEQRAYILDENNECIIPHEVTDDNGLILVNLSGFNAEDVDENTQQITYRINTFQLKICKCIEVPTEADVSEQITPSLFEQYVALISGYASSALASKNAAHASEQSAAASALSASGSASSAGASASSAETSAANASQSATDAATAQTAAEEARDEAQAIKDEALTEISELVAESEESITDLTDTSKGEINTLTASKKSEISAFAETKKGELDDYEADKETELDTHTTTKKAEITSHTTTKIAEINAVVVSAEARIEASVEEAAGYADDAELAKTGAETAQAAAETAQVGAETAETGAETAETGAETAQAAAELAQAAAESAKAAAQASAEEIEDLTVSATGLPAGSTPTATKTGGGGEPYNIALGIPKGDKGDKGDDGTSFVVKGLYATYAELIAAHPTGEIGDAYSVGTEESNVVYLWDVDATQWKNIGSIKGPKGDTGQTGPQGEPGQAGRTPIKGTDYFTPSEIAEIEADVAEVANDYTDTKVGTEATARQTADNGLQAQIDALVSKSDVVDVVGTYAELLAYDTSALGDKDVVKVLTDSTHDNSRSYYRWSTATETWTYIGSESVGYTKAEADALLNEKADADDIPTTLAELTGDSTHRVVTDAEKSTWNGKQDTINDLTTIRTGAGKGNTAIQPNDNVSQLANDAGYLTLSTLPIYQGGVQ